MLVCNVAWDVFIMCSLKLELSKSTGSYRRVHIQELMDGTCARIVDCMPALHDKHWSILQQCCLLRCMEPTPQVQCILRRIARVSAWCAGNTAKLSCRGRKDDFIGAKIGSGCNTDMSCVVWLQSPVIHQRHIWTAQNISLFA